MVDWYKDLTTDPVTPPGLPTAPSTGKTDWYREVAPIPEPMQIPTVSQETAGAASLGDVAVASLAEDPQAQIRWYSQQMGIPQERFGVVEGQIVYATPEGQLQAVSPGFMRGIATGAGPALPAVGGALGTIGGLTLGAPSGPGAAATAAAGGIAGATAGQTARDVLAQQLMGQPLSAWRPTREAAFDLGATVAGLAVAKGYSRVLATRAAKEVNRLIRQEGRLAMDAVQEALQNINKRYKTDIRLTPAEISNAAPLRAQQMAMESRPVTSQQLEDFYASRAGQTEKTMQGFLSEVSPSISPEAAGEGLQQASAAALKNIQRERMLKGSPFYQKAFRTAPSIDLNPVITKLDETYKMAGKPLKAALTRLRREMLVPATDATGEPIRDAKGRQMMTLIDDLELIQNRVKETLDDEIDVAMRAGRSKAANRLMQVKDSLLTTLDKASPEFRKARALWGDLSGPVTKAEGGVLPQLAGKTAKDFEYMGSRFLSQGSPSEIARARKAILAVPNGGASWDAAIKGYLGQRWEQAGRVFKSKLARPSLAKAAQPAAFWAEMIGNPEQARRLRSAMSARQWEGFKRLMRVFEATGRATNYNSTTAAQQQAQQMLDATGKGSALFKSAVNPFGVPRRVADWADEMVTEANLRRLVDVITTSDSIDELLKINVQNAARDRNMILVAKAFNLARAEAISRPDITRLPDVPLESAP